MRRRLERVVLGWIMGREMTLHFETFETVAFFLAALVVTLLIQDGKSNYLEGVLCLVSSLTKAGKPLDVLRATMANLIVKGMYIIIALAFYVYPDQAAPNNPSNPFNLGGT